MVSIHDSFSQQLLHSWRESFQSPHDQHEVKGEDEAYVAALDCLDASEDIIGRFMSLTQENYACPDEKQAVASFCADVNMEALEKVTDDHKVSLFDESNDDEGSGPPHGGLSAFNLYKALRRPVSEVSCCYITLVSC